jgi:hypothetical protein
VALFFEITDLGFEIGVGRDELCVQRERFVLERLVLGD